MLLSLQSELMRGNRELPFYRQSWVVESLVCFTLEVNISSLESLAKVNSPFWLLSLLEIPNTRWVPAHLGSWRAGSTLSTRQLDTQSSELQQIKQPARGWGIWLVENGGSCQEGRSWTAGKLGRSQPCSWPAGWNLYLPAWCLPDDCLLSCWKSYGHFAV